MGEPASSTTLTAVAAGAAGEAKGQAQFAANCIGFLDRHLRQIADNIGYTVPPMPA
ncbi:TPA: hypothetical protein MDU43_004838 [Klebsiella pneumoniae]|uniref:hypothetical protein n=1 Tax=Klebsiella pneumoniae TaxID=573 RepID=UPI0025A815D6|nr:hypothetical protein [Klebsiella pneumoniae]HBT0298252.1 hypothetical protein [Klebsiella pneumoniae]HBV3440135.1 hypothetical protein [Klebsiella pneumoniae]